MRLHVFNPEHDLALAFGGERFTAPRAGREMRRCLGFLPAFWAGPDDFVMVDDVEMALEVSASWRRYFPGVRFVPFRAEKSRVKVKMDTIDSVDVWGWDAAIRRQLLRAGVGEWLLPSSEQLTAVRCLSSRSATVGLLADLVREVPGTVGGRMVATTLDEVRAQLCALQRVVLKAPWSSSGRGVRYVEGEMTVGLEGFVRNTIALQGCVIVEPFYDKVIDFGVEFVADGKGWMSDAGLSIFGTVNGAYVGNSLLSEDEKMNELRPYIKEETLREAICLLQSLLGVQTTQVYAGPLGVDMMVVRVAGQYLLHPCVEVNLRRTMGHVALDIHRRTHGDFSQMQIVFDGTGYRLLLQ